MYSSRLLGVSIISEVDIRLRQAFSRVVGNDTRSY